MGNIKDVVKEKYGQAALRVVEGEQASCGCSPSSCCSSGDVITSNLYSQLQKDELPEAAVLASLGCGNPTALAELKAKMSWRDCLKTQRSCVLDWSAGGVLNENTANCGRRGLARQAAVPAL